MKRWQRFDVGTGQTAWRMEGEEEEEEEDEDEDDEEEDDEEEEEEDEEDEDEEDEEEDEEDDEEEDDEEDEEDEEAEEDEEEEEDEVIVEWRRLYNEELYNLYSSRIIIRMIKSRGMRWEGHVASVGDRRSAYRFLVGKETTWKA